MLGWRQRLSWRIDFFAWEEEFWLLFSDTMTSAYICKDLEDKWVWKIGTSMEFTVKGTCDYLLANSPLFSFSQDESNLFRNFWSCCAPSKVLAFSWKLLLDRLPTYMNLLQRNVFSVSSAAACVLCKLVTESAIHLFLHCPLSVKIWQ